MRFKENDLLTHQTNRRKPPHGDADEVRRDDDAGDERLDAVDEAHLRVLFEAGRGDDHVAYARRADDALRIVKAAEDRIFRSERRTDGMIVEEPDDATVKAHVVLERPNDALGREPRPNEEDRHAKEAERIHTFPIDIAPRPKEENDEGGRQADEEP